jgi:hypothetical protein
MRQSEEIICDENRDQRSGIRGPGALPGSVLSQVQRLREIAGVDGLGFRVVETP